MQREKIDYHSTTAMSAMHVHAHVGARAHEVWRRPIHRFAKLHIDVACREHSWICKQRYATLCNSSHQAHTVDTDCSILFDFIRISNIYFDLVISTFHWASTLHQPTSHKQRPTALPHQRRRRRRPFLPTYLPTYPMPLLILFTDAEPSHSCSSCLQIQLIAHSDTS